jgi:hypothetical protein
VSAFSKLISAVGIFFSISKSSCHLDYNSYLPIGFPGSASLFPIIHPLSLVLSKTHLILCFLYFKSLCFSIILCTKCMVIHNLAITYFRSHFSSYSSVNVAVFVPDSLWSLKPVRCALVVCVCLARLALCFSFFSSGTFSLFHILCGCPLTEECAEPERRAQVTKEMPNTNTSI